MVLKKGTEDISYDRKDSGRQSKLSSPEYKSNLYCLNQIVAGENEMLSELKILGIF
jgi:hypothetical protein